MIKLPTISAENVRAFYKDVFKRIKELLAKNSENPRFERIVCYCSTDGRLDDSRIEQLVIGDIAILTDAISQIGTITEETKVVVDEFSKAYANFCNRNFGRTWAQRIGVTTCPYCNRSYIFTSSKKGTRPQYDHYFPKSKYPYLALSMYNLIPCCSICNGLKHDVDTCHTPIVYPYKDSYGRQVSFEAASRESDDITALLGAAEKYQIKIKYAEGIDPELKRKIEQAVSLFKLEDLYSKHSDYVRDILRTAYIYNDDYFEGLVAQYGDLFRSKQDARDFVFFNYLDEPDWGKRVLAKLTHDIVEEAIG